jgi:hypothetical protein
MVDEKHDDKNIELHSVPGLQVVALISRKSFKLHFQIHPLAGPMCPLPSKRAFGKFGIILLTDGLILLSAFRNAKLEFSVFQIVRTRDAVFILLR